jgi:hypothetical protein
MHDSLAIFAMVFAPATRYILFTNFVALQQSYFPSDFAEGGSPSGVDPTSPRREASLLKLAGPFGPVFFCLKSGFCL